MRGVLSAAYRTVEEIQGRIIPDLQPQPVDQGLYRSSWRAEPTDVGADLVNTAPYASIIEWGARAENIKISRVMIDMLTEWVQRKGLVGKGEGPQAARSVAWAIAVSMKTKGIFNRDGVQGLRVGQRGAAFFRTIVSGEIARELRRSFG
jgi:hypothetical protein